MMAFRHCRAADCVAIDQAAPSSLIVIAVPDHVREDGPAIQCSFNALRYWMPLEDPVFSGDQLRKDGQKLSGF